jgi:hypothetical protein
MEICLSIAIFYRQNQQTKVLMLLVCHKQES